MRDDQFIYASIAPVAPKLQKLLPDTRSYTLRNYAISAVQNADLDSNHFIHPQHRCLVDWFRSKYRDDVDGVIYSRFDPLDVKPALGTIVLLEPTDDYADYRYRLYGSQIVDTYGVDLTGRTSGELNTESTRNVRPQYQTAARNNITVYTEHDLERTHELDKISRWDRWSRLILPLIDEDAKVKRLLVSMVATEIPFNSV
ncbi:PAS domain-containing protein [Nisaea nitritireducens]|uniref:PAS domain-containing protein n=1 Tax=Nisaea nitritireducens TaxID=568392 RepID=UPI00186740F6|nr:PAS domain-containing protein [Nisaea nitritireducens]